MKTEERIKQEMAQLELQIADLRERIDESDDRDVTLGLTESLLIVEARRKALEWVSADNPTIVATSALQYTCGGCLVAHLVELCWPEGSRDIVCPSCGQENHVMVSATE